jgi:hypothetical protein
MQVRAESLTANPTSPQEVTGKSLPTVEAVASGARYPSEETSISPLGIGQSHSIGGKHPSSWEVSAFLLIRIASRNVVIQAGSNGGVTLDGRLA